MTQPTIYFAHPICDYGTQKEADIITFLEARGYTVVNPADFQNLYQYWLDKKEAFTDITVGEIDFPAFDGTNKMAFWVALAQACDECAFCSFDSDLEAEGVPPGYKDTTGSAYRSRPNIRIGAGVWKEVNSFLEADKPAMFVGRTLVNGTLIGGNANQRSWYGPEHYTETNEDNTQSTIIGSRNMTEWHDGIFLLTVEQTKALLRASGRYNG